MTVPNRFFIFGSPKTQELLKKYKFWFGDGTFKKSPNMFYQLYTLHVLLRRDLTALLDDDDRDVYITALYIIMTRKTLKLYKRVFEEIRVLLNFNDPTQVMLDFEAAAIEALLQVFRCNIRNCSFHHRQSVYRNIQAHGLGTRYNNETDFAHLCHHIAALSFVPTNDVIDAFEALTQYLPPELEPVVTYFESTYIGKPRLIGNGRKDPM
jgi:hypothetical protein